MMYITNKKILGQYFTTNYEYILQNLNIDYTTGQIIEPFCGNGDLLKILDHDINFILECYDIEPKKNNTIQKDVFLDPPNFNNKFIITNPPYLARNKSLNKNIFDKYKINDLYKCFIKEICINKAFGGILIIPLNFWSSIRKADIDLRNEFLNLYKIIKLNIFEEKVFDDTTYSVCSFSFKLKNGDIEYDFNINTTIYPSTRNIIITLNKNNNFIIGGEIYKLKQTEIYKIIRMTRLNTKIHNTNIVVKCIDDNEKNQIKLFIVDNINKYIDNTPNLSCRTYAVLSILPKIDLDKQNELVNTFNIYITKQRKIYNSLFLTNYRESKDIARKRISFDLVYKICNHILSFKM
jgi:hypothetical protein